jgi:hypothetical protein
METSCRPGRFAKIRQVVEIQIVTRIHTEARVHRRFRRLAR